MKLKDLLTKLNDAITADKTIEEKDAVDVIHSTAPADVFQVIFDRGHSTGLAKGTTKNTEAESKFAAEKTRADEAERQLKEFKDKHPDAAKLQESYQADLTKKDEEHKATLLQKDQEIEKERRGRARSDLIRYLGLLGVDKDYAEVQADKAEYAVRIKFDKEGKPEVLQKGKEIAIVPTADKDALAMLAAEIHSITPAKFLTSNAKGGGGLDQDNGGNGSDKKTTFSEIRKQEKERQKSPTGNVTAAAERLGSRRRETTSK